MQLVSAQLRVLAPGAGGEADGAGLPRHRGGVADGHPLVHQRRVGDLPACPDLAQPAGVGYRHVGEEDLVELGLAGELAQRADLDPGRVHVQHEIGKARVLGHVGVGAGEQQGPVGVVGERRPHLLAVDHPAVAVADRPGGQAGQVAARAGLAEQLAPDVVGQPQRLQPAGLLLVGAEGEQRRRRHAQADRVAPRVEPGRARPGELLVGGRLQRPRQAEAAVPGRVVHGGQARVELGAEELRSRGGGRVVPGAEGTDPGPQVRFLLLAVAHR